MSAERGRLAYDLHATFEENARRGPLLGNDVPTVPETPTKRFLGLAVGSRFGIAAGLLPNSRWIGPYARRGFDLLTYKTVRSVARASHPMPNWVFVERYKSPHRAGQGAGRHSRRLDQRQFLRLFRHAQRPSRSLASRYRRQPANAGARPGAHRFGGGIP